MLKSSVDVDKVDSILRCIDRNLKFQSTILFILVDERGS